MTLVNIPMLETPSLLFIPLEMPEDSPLCLTFSILAEHESHLCEVLRNRQQASNHSDFSIQRVLLILVNQRTRK